MVGYDVDAHVFLKKRVGGFDNLSFDRLFSMAVKFLGCRTFP